MKMSSSEANNELSTFMETGFYRFKSSKTVFIDPVRVLNRSYNHFRVSPSAYYTRFFDHQESRVSANQKKRKRKSKMPYALNDTEKLANKRHLEVRTLLVKAHEALVGAKDLLAILQSLRSEGSDSLHCEDLSLLSVEHSFVELGRVWQAPLYEITLTFPRNEMSAQNEGVSLDQSSERRVLPVFNNFVVNETSSDVEAEFLGSKYLLPRKSCFHMSDLGEIHNLIPAESDCGFNLILVDPPWENSSAHQKAKYLTLPNRYFLSLPIKQLTHTGGALVALWVTNREKLRCFVEKELFPSWGVKYVSAFYWLKVKADGSLISELDLFHHRPYECLMLGYCSRENTDLKGLSISQLISGDQVFISIPGDCSRKPPVGELLLDYVPGFKPARCLELFAREMLGGWTSWGNEPLRFQDSRYFLKRADD